MPVSPITSTTPPLSSFSGSNTSTTRAPSQTLGENDFLKLLSVQLEQQDPMKPMDDTSFIAQTAQFTSLQQMSQLNQQQQMLTGASYIGKTVTVQKLDGTLVTGMVSALDNSGTTPAVVIGDTSYDLSTVKRIEPGPVATTGTGTTDSTSGTTTPTASGTDPSGPTGVPTPTPSTNNPPTSATTKG